jgi:hypothetical protein
MHERPDAARRRPSTYAPRVTPTPTPSTPGGNLEGERIPDLDGAPAGGPVRARGGAAGRALRVVLLLFVPGLAATVAAVAATGAAAPSAFADPGAWVRWGLPIARVVGDLAGSLTLGLLLLAAFVLTAKGAPDPRHPRVRPAAMHPACAAAVVWALAALARLVLGYAVATGQGLGDPGVGTELLSYVTQLDAGRWAAAAVVGAALIATLTAGITRRGTAGAVVVLALAVLGAQALSDAAVSGWTAGETVLLWLHAVGAAVVVGGLGGLLLLAPRAGAPSDGALPRLIRPATVALALVALGGLGAAGLQLSARPGTPAVWSLLAVKALALVAVAVLIWSAARRATAPTAGRTVLLAAALAVGAVAVGAGVALATGG